MTLYDKAEKQDKNQIVLVFPSLGWTRPSRVCGPGQGPPRPGLRVERLPGQDQLLSTQASGVMVAGPGAQFSRVARLLGRAPRGRGRPAWES